MAPLKTVACIPDFCGGNLYTYVGNDPANKTDPKGLYNCLKGSEAQCDVVDKAIAQARASEKNMSKKQADKAEAALKFIGTRGDKNSVVVSGGKTERDAIATTATANGVTNITINAKITSIGGMQRSAGVSAGGVITHEGQHGIDETTVLKGRDHRTYTNQERFDTERRAYTTQSYVERALHYADSGLYPLNDPNPASNGWSNATNRAWTVAGAEDVTLW